VETIQRVRAVLPQFQLSLPPSVHLEIAYDQSQNIKSSIDDVELTLVIAAALVVLVIFAFLRRVSATLIPSLALPIAVIGNLRRHVDLRLQSRQSVADGADPVGGFCGG